MSLKFNINKIHGDLLNNFENVEVNEKSSLELGEYIEFKALNEGKELIMLVQKRQVELDSFAWGYYSNPKSKEFLVERNSTLDGLIDDVKDIFEKNRFDEEYIKEIN